MDELFFHHAESEGVKVFDSTMVDSIEWNGPDPYTARPIAANWSNRKANESGKISFDWLVDASGRNGVIQTKYLKNREFRESLRNVAVWGKSVSLLVPHSLITFPRLLEVRTGSTFFENLLTNDQRCETPWRRNQEDWIWLV